MTIFRCAVARVFTNGGKNGNPLGVVGDASALSAAQMQTIAKKLGYSETSFVFCDVRTGDYRVRFFTPEREIPFAGHPAIGTLYVLRALGMVKKKAAYVQVIGARKVPLSVLADGRILMEQGKPSFAPGIARALAAALVGMDEADVCGEPLVVSTGLPHLIIPLKGTKQLRGARIRNAVYQRALKNTGAACVMPFTIDKGKIRCRMFAPALGVAEDPATGSGCGPLAAYIVRQKLILAPKDAITLDILQGGAKQSLLTAWVRRARGRVASVAVGGFCAMDTPRAVRL